MLRYLIVFLLATSAVFGQGPGEDCGQPRDPTEYCRECRASATEARRQNLDYFADPCNCTNFYHCFNGEDGLEGILKTCAEGFAWSQKAIACLPLYLDDEVATADQSPITCLDEDPCHETAAVIDAGYWVDTNCGIFYQCSNYHSNRKCCPLFHSFNLTSLRCDINDGCIEHEAICNITGIEVPMLAPTISSDNQFCTDQFNSTRAVDTNASPAGTSFLTRHPNGTFIVEFCAPNTTFRLESCKCDAFGESIAFLQNEDCFLQLSCEGDEIVDTSPQNQYVDNNGSPNSTIEVLPSGEGVCNFGGQASGWLELPFGQTQDKLFNFSVCFWLRHDDCTQDQTIASNRGEDNANTLTSPQEPSILLTSTVSAGIQTVTLQIRRFSATDSLSTLTTNILNINCDPSLYRHICFTYDGFQIISYLNGAQLIAPSPQSGSPQGIFWANHCPLVIGHDAVESGGRVLDGALDEFVMCRNTFSAQRVLDTFNAESGAYTI